MHISFVIGGQMAFSVFSCELVSIWLFVYPSVTFSISDATHCVLIRRDRMMHGLHLRLAASTCSVLSNGANRTQIIAFYFNIV